jgi:hypothetical protein
LYAGYRQCSAITLIPLFFREQHDGLPASSMQQLVKCVLVVGFMSGSGPRKKLGLILAERKVVFSLTSLRLPFKPAYLCQHPTIRHEE